MDRYEEGDQIFDGRMHRPFSENTDGWLNSLSDFEDNIAVKVAQEIVSMADSINYYQKLCWKHEQELKRLRSLVGY